MLGYSINRIFLNHAASTFVYLLIFIQSYFTLLCRHIATAVVRKIWMLSGIVNPPDTL